jgi:hypothetical protein
LFISYSQSLGKIIDGKINIGNGWASDAGIYEVCSNISEKCDCFLKNY